MRLLWTPTAMPPLASSTCCCVQAQVAEKYSLALSSTLNLDGTPTEPLYNAVRSPLSCSPLVLHAKAARQNLCGAAEAMNCGFPAALQAMQSTRSSLMDNYDYVMFGRIFKYKDAPSQGQVRWPPT